MAKGKTSNIATAPLRGSHQRDGNGRDRVQATKTRCQYEPNPSRREGDLKPGRGISNPV